MSFDDCYRLSAHAIITNEDKQILQVKATYADCSWGLPGGALEPGETIHQALIRECVEELGVNVQILYLSGVYFHKRFHSHVFIFRCQIPTNSLIQLSHEHSEFRYFSLVELSAVQKQRVEDCLNFNGYVKSASF